jgi:Cys-rich repeat protein
MEWGTILTFAIGLPVILFPLAFVWYLNIGGISAAIRERRALKLLEKSPSSQSCAIDSDCPSGYVCINGRCVPEGA